MAGPSWGHLGRLRAVEGYSTMSNDADQRMTFPLVSADVEPLVRPRPWSPRRSCQSRDLIETPLRVDFLDYRSCGLAQDVGTVEEATTISVSGLQSS
jgi:hypothetical protein